MMSFFEIVKKSKKSKARTGILHTSHGNVLTPAFVPVATKGTLKTIPPKDIKAIGVQIAFVNTFHLVLHPGLETIKKFGGIHEYGKLDIPLMSDSGGFQVFSLSKLVRIGEEGVEFRSPYDGREFLFTPEFSMHAQEKIGADIVMAFDECIYHGASKEYAKDATERTHQWLMRCIRAKNTKHKAQHVKQFLYGIVQGGMYKNLRVASATFVVKQSVDGIAIGGVSVGESRQEMRQQVQWCSPHLPEDLPRHLLGIGRIEDIAEFVRLGIDTFDCVEPTRLARNGAVYCAKKQNVTQRIDLTKSRYGKDKNPIEANCSCYTCLNFSLSFLHHLFKEKELLAYYLATHHNLYFFEHVFEQLRKGITTGRI